MKNSYVMKGTGENGIPQVIWTTVLPSRSYQLEIYICHVCWWMTDSYIIYNDEELGLCHRDSCRKNSREEDDGYGDGRWMEAVNEYASTCDGCHELTMHEDMVCDSRTQLGYCPECVKTGNTPPRLLYNVMEEDV